MTMNLKFISSDHFRSIHLSLHVRSRGVLTGLKVSSLVRTCVFCRPELIGK